MIGGRFILKILPWWSFLPVIFILAPLSWSQYQDYKVERDRLEMTKSLPAPTPVDLRQLSLPDDRGAVEEIAFLGEFYGTVAGIEAGKIDYGFALIEPTDGKGAWVAVVTEGYLFDLLLKRIEASRQADGQVLIRGFEEQKHRFSRRIKAVLTEHNAMPDGALYVVEAYWSEREKALDARTSSNFLLVVVAVGSLLIFCIITLVKLTAFIRRTRKRAKEKWDEKLF